MPARSEQHDGADDRDIRAGAGQLPVQSQGDFRGQYGYGRPAHGTDPNASYGFETNLLKTKRSR